MTNLINCYCGRYSKGSTAASQITLDDKVQWQKTFGESSKQKVVTGKRVTLGNTGRWAKRHWNGAYYERIGSIDHSEPF
ncbi:MAG: hypothetical protein COB51_14205 [Moraxellaceae bacterium]|nr:MAG: hypothetical protein COB51_14205 [Moraxellaceae bacterium]